MCWAAGSVFGSLSLWLSGRSACHCMGGRPVTVWGVASRSQNSLHSRSETPEPLSSWKEAQPLSPWGWGEGRPLDTRGRARPFHTWTHPLLSEEDYTPVRA